MMARLSRERAYVLLDQLCVELGFCLPPNDRTRLVAEPPDSVKAFTDAVFTAEGLDPDLADSDLYRQVQAEVAKAFQAEAGATR